MGKRRERGGVSVCGGQRQCLDLGLSGSPVLPHSSDPAQDNHTVYLAEHFGPEVSSFTEGMKFSHFPRVR